jgi:hypothetical protein
MAAHNLDQLRGESAGAREGREQSTFEELLSRESSLSSVSMGFENAAGFALLQRAAKVLNKSTMVPVQYRDVIEKTDRYGVVTERKENPNGLANCIVALNMATRMKADPLMIMQNLYPVEGRPSWSAQFIIGAINSCGKFSPLRFDIKDLGEQEVEFQESYWEEGNNGKNYKKYRTQKLKVRDMECIAWVREKETGDRLESTPISIGMAVAEGWYQKNGSKWQTMPGQMLRYRAAAFFGRIYAPELLMGLRTYEEEVDMKAAVEEIAEAAEYARDPVPIAKVRQPRPRISTREEVPAPEGFSGLDSRTGEITQAPPEPAKTQHSGIEITAQGPVDAVDMGTLGGDPQTQAVPGLADALAAIKNGDPDMARDIARDLLPNERKIVEDTLAKREQAPQVDDEPAPARPPRSRDRGPMSIE